MIFIRKVLKMCFFKAPLTKVRWNSKKFRSKMPYWKKNGWSRPKFRRLDIYFWPTLFFLPLFMWLNIISDLYPSLIKTVIGSVSFYTFRPILYKPFSLIELNNVFQECDHIFNTVSVSIYTFWVLPLPTILAPRLPYENGVIVLTII